MIKIAVVCSIFCYSLALYPPQRQVVQVEELDPPRPYEFSYDIKDDDGNMQSRQESGDENGHMKGSYAIQSLDGIRRWVEYIADDKGFRAVIRTNEPGTDNQNPADVQMTVEKSPKLTEAPKREKKKAYKIIRVPIDHEY